MMEIRYVNIIGSELYVQLRKSYAAGIASVIKKNKKLFFDEPRNLFKVDYTAEDLQALANFKVEAFTVAGVGVYELDKELKELAVDSWKNNQDPAEFKRLAREKILQYVPIEDVPPGGWLETNLNTAIGSAYHGAEWIRLQDSSVTELYPALKYMTRNDSKVRDSHRILHGETYYKQDAIWGRIYPPNGWNCRCYVIPIDNDELAAMDKKPEINTPEEVTQTVKQMEIEKGFDRNPGEVKSIWGKWIDTKMADMNYDEVYNSMVEYANANKMLSDFKFTKEELITVNNSMGQYEKKVQRDYDSDRILLNADEKSRRILSPVLRSPSEVWGTLYAEATGQANSMNYIKYTKEGIVVVVVKNAEIVKTIVTNLDGIGQYRKGTLMFKEF